MSERLLPPSIRLISRIQHQLGVVGFQPHPIASTILASIADDFEPHDVAVKRE
jgi:hypothetical protein